MQHAGQVETEETENGNGKLKRKTEAEIGNGIAEIGKWSSTILALMASLRMRDLFAAKKWHCQCLSLDIYHSWSST